MIQSLEKFSGHLTWRLAFFGTSLATIFWTALLVPTLKGIRPAAFNWVDVIILLLIGGISSGVLGGLIWGGIGGIIDRGFFGLLRGGIVGLAVGVILGAIVGLVVGVILLKIRYKDYVNLSGWTSSGFNVTPVAT